MDNFLFFEKVIIKFLFLKENIRERTIYYIVPDIFDGYENISIIKKIKEMYSTYGKFPLLPELKMEMASDSMYKDAFVRLNEIMELDISGYSDEYLLGECANFIRVKLSLNYFAECAGCLKENKFLEATAYPDKIREALSFSFDTSVGLDFLEDAERIYKFLHNRERVISFGIRFFDQYTKGGMHEKSLTLLLAQTNLGKTFLMCAFCANNLRTNHKILYVTCEMSEDKISERVLANLWAMNINELDTLNQSVFTSRFRDIGTKGKLIIKEYPPSTITANNIRNLLKELEVKKKFKPDVIYLDYIELIKPVHSKKGENSYTEYKRVSEEIRAIAVEYGMPIVSAIQSNRAGFGQAELDLKHVSESIGLSFTGDIVIGVTQPPELKEVNKFSVMFLKNRYGLNGKKGLIGVDIPKMRIYDEDVPVEVKKEDVSKAVETIKNTMDKSNKALQEKFIEWD